EEERKLFDYRWYNPGEEVPPELLLEILRRRPGVRFRNWLRRVGRSIRDFDLRGTFLGARKKELGSQARPGQAVGMCSTGCPQPPPPTQGNWNPHCEHTTLVIRCTHRPFRKYELKLPPDPNQASNQLYAPRFEVVGGCARSPDIITCSTVVTKGPCQRH